MTQQDDKIYKRDSSLEVKLQKIEKLLDKLNITIFVRGDSLAIENKDKRFKNPKIALIEDIDTHEGSYELPRIIDSERLTEFTSAKHEFF